MIYTFTYISMFVSAIYMNLYNTSYHYQNNKDNKIHNFGDNFSVYKIYQRYQ